jgi:hypothetical protein
MQREPAVMDEDSWALGWRMVDNYWEENYSLAELQFDSLIALDQPMDEGFLIRGLKIKQQLSKEEEVIEILLDQPEEVRKSICVLQFTKGLSPCAEYPKESVENKELQLELIKLFVADQAIRGNMLTYIISKYNLDSTTLKAKYDRTLVDEVNIDELNTNRLKELINEFGFPTRKLVGEEAMRGVFLIIQHADWDKEWQKSQLANIKLAAEKGDIDKKDYAYLFDRVRVNNGEPQRFGTQFERVDRKNKIAELRDTEDLEFLDQRRRAMGMMPIKLYKKLILE